MEQKDIRQWLEEVGFGQYAEPFEKAGITTELLPALAEKDLILMNIQSEDDRKKLIELAGAAPFKFRYDLFYFILDGFSANEKICGWCFQEFDFLEYAIDILQDPENISLLNDPRHKIAFMRQFGLACLCMANLIKKNNNIDSNKINITLGRILIYGIFNIIRNKSNISQEIHENMYKQAIEIQKYLISKYGLFFIGDLEITYKNASYYLDIFNRKTKDMFSEAEKYIGVNLVKKKKEQDKYKPKGIEAWLINFYLQIIRFYNINIIINIAFFLLHILNLSASFFALWYINTHIIQAISISSITISCFYLLNQCLSLKYPWIPSPFSGEFVSVWKIIGIISATIYYSLFNHEYYVFLIPIILIMYPVHTIILARWYIAREVYVTYILWKEFKEKKIIREKFPVVLVMSGDGLWQFKMKRSGWRVHRILRDAWDHGEVFFLFYTINWKNIKGWYEFLLEKSDAILINNIVPSSLIDEMLQSEFKLDALTSSQMYHHDRPNNHCDTKGKIITFQSGIDGDFELYSDVETLVLKSELLLESIVLKRNPNENKIIAEMAKLIANSTAEVAYSDSLLSQQCNAVIHSLKKSGLRPVSQAYLRVRLANSNIERFLCLMDAVELLVRLSVILLLTIRWNKNDYDAEFEKKLSYSSLGDWGKSLRQLLQELASPFGEQLAAAWSAPLFSAAKQLINESSEAGLVWKTRTPTSWFAWIDWFVFMRNKTRGHGLVDDNVIGNLWHLLHETFLDLVRNIDVMTLNGKLISNSDGEIKGWTRFCKKYKFPEKLPVSDMTLQRLAFSSPEEDCQRLNLYPFILLYKESVLVWNSRRGNNAEYINYNTGNVVSIFVGNETFHTLWEKSNDEIYESECIVQNGN